MPAERFPCLLEFPHCQGHPLASGRPQSVGGSAADVALDNLPANRVLFRVHGAGDRWELQAGDSGVPLSVDELPVRTATLGHLALIQAGPHLLVFVAWDDPRVSSADAANRWLIARSLFGEGTTALAGKQTVRLAATPKDWEGSLELPGAIPLRAGQMLIGRDAQRADICLPDIGVSRVHAWISRSGHAAMIGDAKSTNGTFVDGQRLRGSRVIREGSEIRIGTYTFVFTGTSLYPLSRGTEAQLVAHHLTCRVHDAESPDRTRRILEQISLVVRPREFVCILGPSGCGKSTLLSALSGRRPAEEGCVLLNGEDLYARFEALKHSLAVVPQRDVLHDVLPLDTALRFTARLRLPTDMVATEIDQRVGEMIEAMHLTEHRFTQIRRLSGGQQKRASWINESLCNPSLIFLDEVTSGLDEQTDHEMMELFRNMADAGKTVVCVTHRLAHVEQYCHLVVILAAGGKLAFVGPPAEALTHFGIQRLADVYRRLQEQTPDQWQQLAHSSPAYEQYVTRRLPEETRVQAPPALRSKTHSLRNALTACRQWSLLSHRYFAIQWAEKRALAMMLGQSLLIAVLLCWLFGDVAQPRAEAEARHAAQVAVPGVAWTELLPETQAEFRSEAEQSQAASLTARLLFMLCISCIWFGCNNAAKEITKERTIFSRERDAGLKVLSYYGSKLALLAFFSIAQALLLYACVRGWTHLGGNLWQQSVLLSATSLTGVALGLAISAVASSEDVAVTMVPLSLIPQIVMAGLIAPLAGLARGFAQLGISAYWGYQGLLASLDGSVQARLRDAGMMDLGREWNLRGVGSVLATHLVAFALVAVVAICLRDPQDNGLVARWTRRP